MAFWTLMQITPAPVLGQLRNDTDQGRAESDKLTDNDVVASLTILT